MLHMNGMVNQNKWLITMHEGAKHLKESFLTPTKLCCSTTGEFEKQLPQEDN